MQTAAKCKINIAFTVPYSPQTNIPAENYFSQMKHVVTYRFKAVNEKTHDKTKAPIQHKYIAYKEYILHQWDEHTKNYYSWENTAKINGVWLNVLENCIEENILTGQHLECKQWFNPSTLHGILTTKRKEAE